MHPQRAIHFSTAKWRKVVVIYCSYICCKLKYSYVMRDKNETCGFENYLVQRLKDFFLFSEILLFGKFQNILQDNVFHLKPWVRSPFCLDKYSDNPGEFNIFFLFISAQQTRSNVSRRHYNTWRRDDKVSRLNNFLEFILMIAMEVPKVNQFRQLSSRVWKKSRRFGCTSLKRTRGTFLSIDSFLIFPTENSSFCYTWFERC